MNFATKKKKNGKERLYHNKSEEKLFSSLFFGTELFPE
jgi:hypothetical protein